MTDKAIWDQEIQVPVETIQYVDLGVQKKLPPGTRIIGITPSGSSYWARTARISATDSAGNDTPFFIKVHQSSAACAMASSEFEAMTSLYALAPAIVAQPIACGEYVGMPGTWFYVCRFHCLSGNLPPPNIVTPQLVKMHQRGATPGAKFGSQVLTYGGCKPQYYPVSDSWEETFTRALDRAFGEEENTQGPNEEMQRLREIIMARVVPRLLRPLETEGRGVVPTLVHGDLWHGNMSTVKDGDGFIIFDATPLYAHYEFELAPWWVPRHKMNKDYIYKYKELLPPSEPREEFEDRGLLYSLRFDLHGSSMYKGKLLLRNDALITMRKLASRYGVQ